MPRPLPPTFTRFVAVPENRSAFVAVRQAADCLCSRQPQHAPNPLFLHGPAGTGKTFLMSALAEEVTRRCPDRVVSFLSAADWKPGQGDETISLEEARACDLLIVEDLHHLSPPAVEPLVQLFDERHAEHAPMVFTALAGPQQLGWPARLASRLACGLVVRLEALQSSSRLVFLQEMAQRRQLAVSRDVLAWLADNLSGGRELEGALTALETLSRMHRRPLDVALVAEHFRQQAEAARPTVESIVQRVGQRFQVEPRRLRSEQRGRSVVLPRQIGMYLARRLTSLSLEEIGTYFGGRDHSTVLHACRKVEQVLEDDPVLGGTVRQLQAELA